MDTSKIVGEKIKSLRESQSISMEELAQRSGLAIEQIEQIEKIVLDKNIEVQMSKNALKVSTHDVEDKIYKEVLKLVKK